MSKTLVIRADAGACMGTGHVMRCIALGQAWQDAGGRVILVSCCDADGIKKRISDEGFELIELPRAYPGSNEDIETTLQVANESGAQWIVVDGYHFELAYQQALRRAGLKLFMFDDYNHLSRYEADVVLNQNICAADYSYNCNADAHLLLGIRHVLLRREFRGMERMERIFSGTGKNLLVTLGGGDAGNLSLGIIEALNQPGLQDVNMKVLAGAASPHSDGLRAAAEGSVCNAELLTDATNMPELMQWADICISAGGSTCWELCYTGLPALVVALAENQRALSEELGRRGAVQCLGWHEEVPPEKFAEAFKNLSADKDARIRLSAAAAKLVDGFGAERVLYPLAKQADLDLMKGRLELRCAQKKDVEILWEWANDPSVRNNCYHPEPIPLEAHRKWFSAKLNSGDCRIWLLELDGIPAGQIRYDRSEENIAAIGFSIERRFRGLGLGGRIVSMSLGNAFEQLQVAEIHAAVFESNEPSQAVFLKTGFEDSGGCAIKSVPSRVFIKKRI